MMRCEHNTVGHRVHFAIFHHMLHSESSFAFVNFAISRQMGCQVELNNVFAQLLTAISDNHLLHVFEEAKRLFNGAISPRRVLSVFIAFQLE